MEVRQSINSEHAKTLDTAARVEATGRRFADVRADLASIAPVDDIVRAALEAFGRVDVLVNNAGISRREDALDFGEDDWDAVMDVNLKRVFFLSQAVARQFVKQEAAARSLPSHRCCRFRAASAWRRIRRRKAACSVSRGCSRTNGPRRAST